MRDYLCQIQTAYRKSASFAIQSDVYRYQVVPDSEAMADRVRPDKRVDDVLWSCGCIRGHGLVGMEVHRDTP